MRILAKIVGFFILVTSVGASARPVPSPADDNSSIAIVFKDGHRQSFAVAEISRIDFKAPSVIVYKDGHQEKILAADIARIEFEPSSLSDAKPGRGHFIGKWEVGDGGGHTFFITLQADGDAKKTKDAGHGTWIVVDGE